MNTTVTTFSSGSNARRAAESMIGKGTAPAVGYGIAARENGRFEIVWKTAANTEAIEDAEVAVQTEAPPIEAEPAAAATPKAIETNLDDGHYSANLSTSSDPSYAPPKAEPEVATEPATEEAAAAPAEPQTAEAAPEPAEEAEVATSAALGATPEPEPTKAEAATEAEPEIEPKAEADPFPPGTRVMVRKGRLWHVATITRQLDPDYWRVQFASGGAGVVEKPLIRAYDAEGDTKPARVARPATPRREAPPRERKALRYSIDPATIAAGKLPNAAPVVTSPTNSKIYQPKFDELFGLASAGDWDGVRDYKVTGSNSYSKLVARFREDLLAVRAAQQAQEAPHHERRVEGRTRCRRSRKGMVAVLVWKRLNHFH